MAKSVADFKNGSANRELFEGNMTKALTLYNQAVEHLPNDEKAKAAVNAVSSIYQQKAEVYKILMENFST